MNQHLSHNRDLICEDNNLVSN